MVNSKSHICTPEEEAEGRCKQKGTGECKDGDAKCTTKRCKEGMGRCVLYSKESYAYDELDMNDKIDFAVFMVNYDINKRKEFAEGAEDARGYRHTASFEMLLKPQKIINLLICISFALFVVFVILCLILYILRVSSVKKSVALWMIITTIGIFCLIFLLEHLYFKVVDNLENIAYNIK